MFVAVLEVMSFSTLVPHNKITEFGISLGVRMCEVETTF